MDTLWYTSDKRESVKSLISLCLIDRCPPFRHDSTYGQQKNLVGHSQGSSHNVKPMHHERFPYGAQSHILQVVELKARWSHLFLERGPWHVLQERVEEHPLGWKLHSNVVLIWICGHLLWQSVGLKGSHIHTFHPV